MTTKFILHGGMLKYANPSNDSYFQELTKDLNDGDTILFIGFSRTDEVERDNVYERDKGLILAQTKAKVKVVNATHKDLIEQIHSAKSIHITGGETGKLVADIKRYPDFINSIKGKTVGGSSADACLFCTYYFYCQEQKVLEGIKVLPICLLVHYGNDEYHADEKALDKLRPFAEGMELLAIKECEWVIREA